MCIRDRLSPVQAQRLLNTIHPRWGMALGLNWAKHSRLKRADGKEEPYICLLYTSDG